MRPTCLFVVCGLALCACDNVESFEVATEDMRLFMDVRVEADAAADVLVQLTTYNDALLEETFINLTAGDRLIASHGEEVKGMIEEQIVPLGIYQYRAECAGVAGDDSIGVSLERPRELDAPDSHVVLPGDFTIDDPGAELSRAAGLSLTWTAAAAAETGRVSVTGDCIDSWSVDFDGNPGAMNIDPGTIAVTMGTVSTTECPATIEVTLFNTGDVDSAYGRGGAVRAYQVRRVEVTTVQ